MKKKYNKFLAKARATPEYLAEYKKLEISDQIFKLMKNLGINQKELAKRMKVSESYVSRILNANANLSVLSMAKIAKAFGCDLIIKYH